MGVSQDVIRKVGVALEMYEGAEAMKDTMQLLNYGSLQMGKKGGGKADVH